MKTLFACLASPPSLVPQYQSIVSDWLEMGDAYTYVQNKENDPRPLVSLMGLQVC